MERKTELLLIIRQLKKDLCDSAAMLNARYPRLDENNLSYFKEDYKEHILIHDKLVSALNEAEQLDRNRKIVASLFK